MSAEPGGATAALTQTTRAVPGWLWGALLVALTLVAYGPAYQAGFVWDDDANVTENTVLRGLAGLHDIWLRPGATTQYYPLVYTSFWLEHAAWGLEPLVYHLDNVLLHAASALLLWRILLHLSLPGAWLAAAIFALHPVHVESVAWVTERKNVLSGLFYLGAALFYLRDVSGVVGVVGGTDVGRRRRGYLFALVLYLAALLAKPPAASLPAALALVVWWKRGRLEGRDFALLIPMLLLALPVAVLTVWLETVVGDHLVFDWSPSIAERALLLGRALWFYAFKLAVPIGLTFIYPRWELDPSIAWQWIFPLAAFAVVCVLFFARQRLGRGPLVAVLFFAGTLVPALGFIEIYFFKFSFVADHWQYLASIGLIALAASLGTRAASRWRVGPSGVLPAALAALLLGGLGLLTWQQSRIYHDVETLWRDTLRKNPEAVLARYNLAHHLHSSGRMAEAKREYRELLRIDPDHPEAHNNLGYALLLEGELAPASGHLRRAIELDPDNMLAHWNLASVLDSQGKTEAAYREFERGLEFEPKTKQQVAELAAGHVQLGRLMLQRKRPADAIRHFRAALEIDGDLSGARRDLGIALASDGRRVAAMRQLKRVLAQDPADGQARAALDALRAEHRAGAPRPR